MVRLLSVMMGGTAALMTTILVISDGAGRSIEALEVLLPSVAALIAVIMGGGDPDDAIPSWTNACEDRGQNQ